MTKNVKIIVGANYGDEGKGLGTDYFCSLNPESTIGVLTNGSAQRGHTVDTKDGYHHVFHHFSSGTFNNIPTYISDSFLINPMAFVKEYNELMTKGFQPKYYIHPDCRVVTPFDMMCNQVDMKKEELHNSCGMGVWRTINRYRKDKEVNLTIKEWIDLILNNKEQAFQELYNIFLYYYESIDGYCTGINITNLIEHFILDICFVVDNAILVVKDTEILNNFETVVFENGQGLALSCYSYEEYNRQNFYLTSTNTGAIIPYRIIERNFCGANVEICYVTRTYLTRHGDGNFDGNFIEYNSDNSIFLFDYTNIYNPFQGKLRYSNFVTTLILKMLGRIRGDFYQNILISNKNNYICSILVTHWNEKPEIHEKLASEIIQQMEYLKENKYNGNFYISDSKYRDSVRIYNKEELEKENK